MAPDFGNFKVFGHSVRRDIGLDSLTCIGLQAALELTELLRIFLTQVVLFVGIFSKIKQLEDILVCFFAGVVRSDGVRI